MCLPSQLYGIPTLRYIEIFSAGLNNGIISSKGSVYQWYGFIQKLDKSQLYFANRFEIKLIVETAHCQTNDLFNFNV